MNVPLCQPNGYVVLDYGVTALLWVAVLMQVAVLRAPAVSETRMATSCRWLVTAGAAGVAARFTALLMDYGDLTLSPYTLGAVATVALGLTGAALDRLMMPPYRRRSTDWGTLDDVPMNGAHR